MLKEFRVDNFKSLINIVFRPQETNLLVGLNNSGKTNLCKAMEFIFRSSVESLDRCAEEAGGRVGLTNCTLSKSTIDFYIRAYLRYRDEELRFEYELTISPPSNAYSSATVEVSREVLRVSGGRFDNTTLIENIAGNAQLLKESEYAPGKEDYIEATGSANTTMLQRLFDPIAHSRAHFFKLYLATWTYYDLSPLAMKGFINKPGTHILDVHGENLASVLFMLKTSRERDYRRLLDVMKSIEPGFDLINFVVGSENSVFMFFEDTKGHRLAATNASNGTLRFLAMAYILLFQSSNKLAPLYMIEEPENGIHVRFLKTLFQMRDNSESRPQLIFTSHSPYFIDLYDEHLNGLFVADQKNGHTSLTQPDVSTVMARLEDFPLGEQHFREMLK